MTRGSSASTMCAAAAAPSLWSPAAPALMSPVNTKPVTSGVCIRTLQAVPGLKGGPHSPCTSHDRS